MKKMIKALAFAAMLIVTGYNGSIAMGESKASELALNDVEAYACPEWVSHEPTYWEAIQDMVGVLKKQWYEYGRINYPTEVIVYEVCDTSQDYDQGCTRMDRRSWSISIGRLG